MRKLIAIICMLMIPVSYAWATGYLTYQADAVNGSDHNTGLPGSPFKTCSFANAISSKGNHFQWKCGQTFGASQNDTCRVGAADSTTDESWGTGEKPTITGAKQITGWTNANQVANVLKSVKVIPDSTYSMWVKGVLCTRVMTEAALNGNNKFCTWPDSTKIFLTDFADTSDVKRSKNYVIYTDKNYGTYNNLIISYGTGTLAQFRNMYIAGSTHNTVKNCKFTDCSTVHLGISSTADNTNIYYNIFSSGCVYTAQLVIGGNNCNVYNNIFVSSGLDAIFLFNSTKSVTIKNNIICSPVRNFLNFPNATWTITASNNQYYAISYTNKWIRGSTNFSTLKSWQDSTGQEANSLTGWPRFAGQADSTSAITSYALAAGSKCINAGVNVGLTSDYYGNPIVGLPDIGAVEMQAPVVTTQAATSIATTSATGNGNIISIGSYNATSRGFEWGLTTGNYTTSVTTSGDYGTGAFTGSLTALPINTQIFMRAKATNPVATVYGAEVTLRNLSNSTNKWNIINNSISNEIKNLISNP